MTTYDQTWTPPSSWLRMIRMSASLNLMMHLFCSFSTVKFGLDLRTWVRQARLAHGWAHSEGVITQARQTRLRSHPSPQWPRQKIFIRSNPRLTSRNSSQMTSSAYLSLNHDPWAEPFKLMTVVVSELARKYPKLLAPDRSRGAVRDRRVIQH